MKKLVKVFETEVCMEKGSTYTAKLTNHNTIEIYKEVEEPFWKDITSECTTDIVPSHSSMGYYIQLIHRRTVIAALGIDRTPIPRKGYKIVKAEGARVSFRALKEVRD